MSAQSSSARHIAVVDVETTGLSPWRHDRIVEIAVVLLSPDGEIEDEYESLVNPGRDVGPTSIHGISASDLIDAPPFAAIVGDVVGDRRAGAVARAPRWEVVIPELEFEPVKPVVPENDSWAASAAIDGKRNVADR